MKKIFTLLACAFLPMAMNAQTAFESDLSSWSGGVPTDWMGSASSIDPGDVTEVTLGVTYGTSMAQLINESSDHVRFTTQNFAVTAGETYDITFYIAGLAGDIRTGFYDVTNASYGPYNDYLDVSSESGGTLAMLEQKITVPSGCTELQATISIRNTDAFGIALDSVNIAVGTAPPTSNVSIYDIQYNTTDPYESPYDGELVTTKGVVTGVFQFGAATGTFFIQDGDGPWNGIYVYEDGTPVALGDSVEVSGEVTEFFTLTEITNVTALTVLNSGNPGPEPVEVSTADVANEEYEGVLCLLTDAVCVTEDAGFGQFEVNDGSGVRLIDDEIFSYVPTLGNGYDIVGVNFLSFGDVKIYPRQLSDITTVGFAGITEKTALEMYPNPAQDWIKLNTASDETVAIYDITGNLVFSEVGATFVDLSELAAGTYQVLVQSDLKTSTAKLIVQ